MLLRGSASVYLYALTFDARSKIFLVYLNTLGGVGGSFPTRILLSRYLFHSKCHVVHNYSIIKLYCIQFYHACMQGRLYMHGCMSLKSVTLGVVACKGNPKHKGTINENR